MQKRRIGTIVDVRVCGWVIWAWVAAQPRVSVPQKLKKVAVP